MLIFRCWPGTPVFSTTYVCTIRFQFIQQVISISIGFSIFTMFSVYGLDSQFICILRSQFIYQVFGLFTRLGSIDYQCVYYRFTDCLQGPQFISQNRSLFDMFRSLFIMVVFLLLRPQCVYMFHSLIIMFPICLPCSLFIHKVRGLFTRLSVICLLDSLFVYHVRSLFTRFAVCYQVLHFSTGLRFVYYLRGLFKSLTDCTPCSRCITRATVSLSDSWTIYYVSSLFTRFTISVTYSQFVY